MADYRNLVLFALRDHAQRGSLPSARQLADEFRQNGIDISPDDLAGTIDRLEREKAIGAARKKREVGKPGEISVYYPRDMGDELERQGIVGPPYRFPHPETLAYIRSLGEEGRAAAERRHGPISYWLGYDAAVRRRRELEVE